nr:MAG TPA: hypothetical protein [Caudoviricetes sp.]
MISLRSHLYCYYEPEVIYRLQTILMLCMSYYLSIASITLTSEVFIISLVFTI